MSYSRHDSLIRPAKPTSHPLVLIIGCVLVVSIYLALALLYARSIPTIIGYQSTAEMLQDDGPVAVVARLFEFSFLIVALTLVLRTLHRRPLLGLIGNHERAALDFSRCTISLLPLFILMSVMPMPEAFRLSQHLAFRSWLLWLPLAVPFIMIQVCAEELVFRGYLQSQLAARFRHPLIWIGLPALLFGLLHYTPEFAGENAWILVVWAMAFGACAADLTARTGTLGPAIALHFVNNAFAILVAAPVDVLDGLAFYTFPLNLQDTAVARATLALELMFTFCAWLTARLALRV